MREDDEAKPDPRADARPPDTTKYMEVEKEECGLKEEVNPGSQNKYGVIVLEGRVSKRKRTPSLAE